MPKELHFTKQEFMKSKFYKDPKAENWFHAGRPTLWVEEYRNDNVVAYIDSGYGKIKLVVNGVAEETKDNGCLVNGEYVLLSAYYGDEYEGKVFKMINPTPPKANKTFIECVIHKGATDRVIADELYDICDRVHATCDDACPVFRLNAGVPWVDGKEGGDCLCFKNGMEMLKFIKNAG